MGKIIPILLVLFPALSGTPSLAADMPVKQEPSTAFTWAGPYAGFAVGGKFGDTTWTTTSTSDFAGTIVDASSPDVFRPSSFRIGGYAGYSWEQRPWVYGVEFDIAYADGETTHAGLPGCAIGCFPGAPGPGVDTASVKLGWDASARARLGYLLAPDILLYGTGGIAWQAVEATGTCQHSAPDPQCSVAPGNPFDTQNERKILTGWTVGIGFETRLIGNWLLRAEYRYADFGSFSGLFPFTSSGAPAGSDYSRFDLAVRTHTATIGVTYQFGADDSGR